jgi:hypothetical protein
VKRGVGVQVGVEDFLRQRQRPAEFAGDLFHFLWERLVVSPDYIYIEHHVGWVLMKKWKTFFKRDTKVQQLNGLNDRRVKNIERSEMFFTF